MRGFSDGRHYTEMGWDFAHQAAGDAFYVDRTRCCRNASTIVQRALTQTPGACVVQMRTFVDSGMIEAYSEGLVWFKSGSQGACEPRQLASRWRPARGEVVVGGPHSGRSELRGVVTGCR